MVSMTKPWDKFRPLELIGQVCHIQIGDRSYKDVYLDNLKMPKTSEDRVQVYFITERGSGQPGYIRSRAVEIIATGAKPQLPAKLATPFSINELAGDQP